MLKIENLNVKINNNHILKDLSCEINRGEFIIILGQNGAGKSTLFDSIAGKIKISSGKIEIDGLDVTKNTEQERASFITRIFQNTNMNCAGDLTVFENLAVANYSRRKARFINATNCLPKSSAVQILNKLKIDNSVLDKKMNSLSGGQRQIISFAMATQKAPKLLLLDEPTAALDPRSATALLQQANKFIKENGITSIMITHDPNIALNMGDKIWILENGKIEKVFNNQEKERLSPQDLIGQIDYKSL